MSLEMSLAVNVPGAAGVAYLGFSEIGYSPRVRESRIERLPDLGAGLSRYALPLQFLVIFEYGGLIP
jgi:hypothetical protein